MSKLVYTAIYLTSILVSSFAQILLKKSSGKKYEHPIQEYINPYVIISYLIFFGSTFCTIFAYTGIDLSFGPVLASSEYIYVAILSRAILKEKINKKKLIGLSVIVIGIVVYSLNI